MRIHPIKFLWRLGYLFTRVDDPTDECVTQSYNRLSPGYDEAWTHHMRDLSTQLIDELNPQGGTALDLTCGTGFVTNLMAQRIGGITTGVDRSEGMIRQARENYGDCCEFIQQDILVYLTSCPDQSLDLVTCAWGLGYSYPRAVLKQIKRVLKPGGHVAIIDNSLFSLSEVMLCSFLSFLEKPQALKRLMRFRFLTGMTQLNLWLRWAGLHPVYLDKGTRTYTVANGQEAIARMRATGAAAGFEYATDPDQEEAVYTRFAEILEQRYLKDGAIDINHRYMAGIAHA
jgi:ubiquinone/menaquinone biosynthesis C-methylase UbiE